MGKEITHSRTSRRDRSVENNLGIGKIGDIRKCVIRKAKTVSKQGEEKNKSDKKINGGENSNKENRKREENVRKINWQKKSPWEKKQRLK